MHMQQRRRIVVKVGTSTVTHSTGKINLRRIEQLARVLTDLKNMDHDVILVSSGAVAAGVGKLGLAERPKDIPSKQAVAAVGQCELMSIYDRLFSEYSCATAQILLEGNVLQEPYHTHAVNTFGRLLEYGVLPIVNENDSVSVEELVIGDNDTLSAIVAEMTGSDLLIILTDIDGLYDKNPRTCEDARQLRVVPQITEEIRRMAGDSGTARGTGGMVTKLTAAERATAAGIEVVIASGADPAVLYDIVEGHSIGTRFLARRTSD